VENRKLKIREATKTFLKRTKYHKKEANPKEKDLLSKPKPVVMALI
jgi:hypothetical protein